jgi:hypothetical protein
MLATIQSCVILFHKLLSQRCHNTLPTGIAKHAVIAHDNA